MQTSVWRLHFQVKMETEQFLPKHTKCIVEVLHQKSRIYSDAATNGVWEGSGRVGRCTITEEHSSRKRVGFLWNTCVILSLEWKNRTHEIQQIPIWDNKAYKAPICTEPCMSYEQTPSDEPHHEIARWGCLTGIPAPTCLFTNWH